MIRKTLMVSVMFLLLFFVVLPLIPPPSNSQLTWGYSATIWSWDYIYGWQIHIPIFMNSVLTSYSTPHTFTGLTGYHTFTVPNTDALGHAFYDWNIGLAARTLTINSAGVFTANYKMVTDTLTVTSPDGGESWRHGTTHTLTWSSSGNPGAYVKIELMKSGVVNRVITSSTLNDGSYKWSISSTQTLGTAYKIRITSTSKSSITDSSNGNFAIITQPRFKPVHKTLLFLFFYSKFERALLLGAWKSV